MKSFVLLLAVATLTVLVQGGARTGVLYRGVNLAGLEFDDATKSGNDRLTFWKTQQPWRASVDYWGQRKATVVRVPFRWDILQPPSNTGSWTGTPNQDPAVWNNDYYNYIVSIVQRAASYNIIVILDLHQYARYPYVGTGNGVLIKDAPTFNGEATVATSYFTSFWQKFAGLPELKNQPNVWFSLMNEPSPNDSCQGFTGSQAKYNCYTSDHAYKLMVAGLTGVRAAGANNKVLVSGTAYSGAHSFANWNYAANFYTTTDNGINPAQKTNADRFASKFTEVTAGGGAGDWAVDVHTYFDNQHTGTQYPAACEPLDTNSSPANQNYNTAWNANAQLSTLTGWATTNGIKLFLGEVGWGATKTDKWTTIPNCQSDAYDLLTYLDANSTPNNGPWLGWAYWAASTHFGTTDASYYFNTEPDYFNCPAATINGQSRTDSPDSSSGASQLGSCGFQEKAAFLEIFRSYYPNVPSSGCWFYDYLHPLNTCPAAGDAWWNTGATGGSTGSGSGSGSGNSGNTGTTTTCVSPVVGNAYPNNVCASSALTPSAVPRTAAQGVSPLFRCCPSGYGPQWVNDNWWECRLGQPNNNGGGSPAATTSSTSTVAAQPTTSGSGGGSCAALWAQCGGIGWTGATCCQSGTCQYGTDYYYQCKPSKKRFSF